MSEPGEARPFPWDEATALAFGVLRWPPDTFWRATPAELFAALRGPALRTGVEPATARDVDRLMRAYPDARIDGDHA